ncbi:CDP-glucose 4,6-dehydratase [Rhizobium sp. BK251]|uniref:CDP-glucose 4,6-dehydratase n=1 Tax=Rhizobium sp. BK251 TaxID=2512125 RepID=UPI0010452935|nr:CDP-glucose 4,6-dehydratase [Rhizobium sp. BK251]TCL75619.1 CDP-glucose 4,6-dehydratase [Rhizobium sp. BK251]
MGIETFWNGRRVFVTGNTGFKGSWLCLWLQRLGAEVHTAALAPASGSLYETLAPWSSQRHNILDVRDGAALARVLKEAKPEIVIHMAAQPLVRRSYADPVETFSTNVMGTVNLLESVRRAGTVRTLVVVTSDKVYRNEGLGEPFAEEDTLGGEDPYSSSKACAELVSACYRDSFLRNDDIAIATARAGNVIGGGDWSEGRLIPDFMRAIEAGEPVFLRYPEAVRPWQHVLEPLSGYLMLAEALDLRAPAIPEALNFGPDPKALATVAEVVGILGSTYGLSEAWKQMPGQHPPEATTLTLDSHLASASLGWKPRLSLSETLEWTAAWYKARHDGADTRALMLAQIEAYEERAPTRELVSARARMEMAG